MEFVKSHFPTHPRCKLIFFNMWFVRMDIAVVVYQKIKIDHDKAAKFIKL